MSDETGREDTVLGTALARAIDSQPVRTTPFSDSRVAVRMAGGRRSPLVPVLAAAAAIVLGLALGAALLGGRGDQRGPVASSPTPNPDATSSPGAASPTPSPEGNDRIWVYFARDQLPPVGAFVQGTFDDTSAERRIASRLRELQRAGAGEVPAGAVNTVSLVGRDGVLGMAVRVEGDLATVEFGPGQFDRIHGSAGIGAVLEQLVYTITEEPGIRRALLAEQGKSELVIDNMAVIKNPATREDVLPYRQHRPDLRTEERVALEDDPRAATLTTKVSDDVAPGLTRFEILMTASAPVAEGFWSPRMSAELRPNNDERALPGKWVLEVTLPGGTDPKGAQPSTQTYDGSPLRAVRVTTDASGTTYLLGLDDARPWRVSLEPVLGAPAPPTPSMRLFIDIGGHPQSVSESIAVYDPRPGAEFGGGAVGRTIVVRGVARAFEAHVAWRLKDSRDREVATGFVTASIGTSPVWGTFETKFAVPDGVTGVVTLEVFWPSPRDGADVGRVAIPLRVR